MQLDEGLDHAFDRIRELVHLVVADLDPAALTWRADPQANTIAWLLWHLSRVQDDHVAEIAGREQVWSQGWAARFGLPADVTDTGYGHTAEQVAAVDPPEPGVLTAYHDAVVQATRAHLAEAGGDDFDRIIDRSYDPPVTVGVRLLSVLSDSLQHVGQAAYVRGLWERREPGAAEGRDAGRGEASAPTGSAEVDLAEVPEAARSRILAATAHAAHRRIERIGDIDEPTFAVEAVSGDRLTLMEVAVRPDGSVSESTQSVTAADVAEIHHGEERVEVVVGGTGGARSLLVSPAAVASLLPGAR